MEAVYKEGCDMTRNSARARHICLETHGREDHMGRYMSCHVCGLRIDPVRTKWRADHIRRHAEGGTESPDNLWPICLTCDGGVDGKAARDTSAIAKGKRMSGRHFGTQQKGRGFYRPKGVKFDWSQGRYRREIE